MFINVFWRLEQSEIAKPSAAMLVALMDKKSRLTSSGAVIGWYNYEK